MPFVTTWMGLQGMMLVVSQTKKHDMISFMHMGSKNMPELIDTETMLVIARGIG